MKTFTEAMTIHKPYGRVRVVGNPNEGTYLDGEVVTKHGIVSVYSQGDKVHSEHSRFDFVFNGKLHIRMIGKRYSKIGLATVAARFASEIVQKHK